ncbi:hypothetical protein XPA_003422 [Xanthoria parietina]
MPPATKKRKIDSVAAKKTTNSALSKQQGIQAFGKVSKSQSGRPPAGKSSAKPITNPQSTVTSPFIPEQSSADRKRKAQNDEENFELQEGRQKRIKSSTQVNSVPSVQVLHPRTPRKKALFKSITIETPTKGARSYLESLNLSSSPNSEQNSTRSASRAETPASSPPPEFDSGSSSELAEELQNLIDLHSSFLTALSLHYAHHGSLTPADFRVLRPNIERSWRKRRVSIQDIQRILALEEHTSSGVATLSLSDYGHSKICIEIDTPSRSISQHKRPLNEELLNNVFVDNLLDKWKAYKTSHKPPAAAQPLSHLSLQKVSAGSKTSKPARSKHKLAPHRTKSPNKENIPPQAIVNSATKQEQTSTRKTNLLDRIKAKQEARFLSAADSIPLTPEQVSRQRALRRLEEIIPVLDLLGSTGNTAIKSFTMPTVVQHLQMSLRNPIEKEEAVRAVRLLAEEVAPGWVGVREIGKLVGVTVRRSGVVGGREAVKGIVKRLIEGV